MCNLYSITRNQDAMRRLFKVRRDLAGNLPLFPAIYPDTIAPEQRLKSSSPSVFIEAGSGGEKARLYWVVQRSYGETALGGTRYGICQHETGCPWPSPGYTVTWVTCGANLDAKVEEKCSIVENGQRKPGR